MKKISLERRVQERCKHSYLLSTQKTTHQILLHGKMTNQIKDLKFLQITKLNLLDIKSNGKWTKPKPRTQIIRSWCSSLNLRTSWISRAELRSKVKRISNFTIHLINQKYSCNSAKTVKTLSTWTFSILWASFKHLLFAWALMISKFEEVLILLQVGKVVHK